MSDGGLPTMQTILFVMVVSCGIVGVITNRRFGHATFFRNTRPSKERSSERRRRTGHCSSYATRRSGLAAASASTERSSRSDTCSKNDSHIGVGFYSIPPGVTEHVLSFSSPAELVGLAPVCGDLYRASESDLLWRALCVRHFGKEATAKGDLWRQQWQQRRQSEEEKCFEYGATTPSGVTVGSSRHGATQAASAEIWACFSQSEEENLPLMSENDESFDRDGIMGCQGVVRTPTATAAVAARNIAGLAMDKGREPLDRPVTISGSFCGKNVCSWREAFFDAHFDRPQELLRTSLPSSCLILVGGRVHDLTEFLPSHPGGAMILREHASSDATAAFELFFHSGEARRMARQFVVWDGEAIMGRKGTLSRIASQKRRKVSTTA